MKLRQSLFWDTNLENIDLQKHARYIIERVMDLGRDEEVRWMWNLYDKDLMLDVAKHSRVLRPDTRELWTNLLLEK